MFPNPNGNSNGSRGRRDSQLTEDDEDEDKESDFDYDDYGEDDHEGTTSDRRRVRTESHETLDSRDSHSSREDVFNDGFETYSDEDEDALRHDRNYQFLKRKS